MKVGYARVSREEQHLELQLDALKAADCEQLFTEKIKSVKDQRPQLEQALQFVRAGDAFVVWRLDRLGRSLKNLLEIMAGPWKPGGGVWRPSPTPDNPRPRAEATFYTFL